MIEIQSLAHGFRDFFIIFNGESSEVFFFISHFQCLLMEWNFFSTLLTVELVFRIEKWNTVYEIMLNNLPFM